MNPLDAYLFVGTGRKAITERAERLEKISKEDKPDLDEQMWRQPGKKRGTARGRPSKED
jgi:hypothetical protein